MANPAFRCSKSADFPTLVVFYEFEPLLEAFNYLDFVRELSLVLMGLFCEGMSVGSICLP